MRKYIGVVSIVLFVVVLGIISFAFFAKKDDNAITQTIFLRKVFSNLEYPIVNNEEELLEILKNQNYQNEDIDWIYRIDGTESQYSESSLQGTMNFLSLLNLIYVRYGLLYRE